MLIRSLRSNAKRGSIIASHFTLTIRIRQSSEVENHYLYAFRLHPYGAHTLAAITNTRETKKVQR